MSEVYQIHHLDEARSHLSPRFIDNLTLHKVSIPSPGPEAVLVRIRAVSLNFRDLLIVAGSPLYPTQAQNGLIPCCDGAGEIVSTGPNSKWKNSIGDSVIVTPTSSWIDGDVEGFDFGTTRGGADVDGLLAQYVVVEDPWLVRAPTNLDFEEAAALPCAGATAINVLTSTLVRKGTTVVAQGTGGVSCFVIQFAAAMGATVIATSSSDEKLQTSKRLGASKFINYKTTPAWGDEVLRLTDGRGADLVADIGGSGTVEESLKALRQGGTACMIGFLAPPKQHDIIQPLVVTAKRLQGIIGFSRKMIEDMVKLVEENDLHPLIKTFEWKDAKKAFEVLRDQDVIGKVVIKV